MINDVPGKLTALRNYHNSGATLSYAFRRKQLLALRDALLAHEEALYEALEKDMKKSREEAWVTEIGFVTSEIRFLLRRLRKWMRPRRTVTNLLSIPSSSYTMQQPLGVVMIIAPWNFPVNLLFTPLAGAIAAGNCVVVKPSELAPATTAVIARIIADTFSPDYVLCATGDGKDVVPRLMTQFRFDHVFYTGGAAVGKQVYQMAAEKLVPVTLELGGKSPCIVEPDADLAVAARRIVQTKFTNAGQMCVSPDYVLVHISVKEQLVQLLRKYIKQFYTARPAESYDYGRIINKTQFDRLVAYLDNGTVVEGGQYNAAELYIDPTLLRNVARQSPVMRDEIFGPVLPLIAFNTKEEALAVIAQHPDPLALYVFTGSRKKANWWMQSTTSGGACINNVSWHLLNPYLPFGGRGNSGMGSYHGKYSFDTFTHRKAVLKTPTWFDPSFRYPPLKGKLNWFRRLLR